MNKAFTCILVDDEPKILKLVASRLQHLFAHIQITGSYTHWKDALEALRETPPDLLLLDISMPEKTGLDLLLLLPELKCEVIFLTAHAGYALEAFRLQASGYILKPVTDAELSRVLSKALERIQLKRQPHAEPGPQKIAIPNNKGLDYINIDDIICLQATARYTIVVLKDRQLLSSYNIGRFKELLGSASFYQVHRSYIIHINHVLRYQSTGLVTLSNNTEVPVARHFREGFLKLFHIVAR